MKNTASFYLRMRPFARLAAKLSKAGSLSAERATNRCWWSLAFILFGLLGSTGLVRAQRPPTCISSPNVVSGQPNWNWEADLYDSDYDKTWRAYTFSSAVGSNSAVLMGAPWFDNNSTEQIRQIAYAKDYTKAKGWRLLRVNFGCAAAEEHPWFVLYNQYTGVLRVFVWLNNLNNMAQGAMISLKQTGNRITAVGANSNTLLNAADYYLNNTVASGSDYISVVVTTAGSVKWASADFQTMLDPNVSNPLFTGTELTFEIHAIQSSDVDLAGQFKFTTEQAVPAISGAPTPTPGVARGNTFITDGKKVIAKINDGVKGAQTVVTKIHEGALALANSSFKGAYAAPSPNGATNHKKTLYDLSTQIAEITNAASASTGSGIQKVLSTVLKVGQGALSAIPALSFIGSFMGMLSPSADDTAAKSIPFTPTISTGDISLTGTIKTVSPQNTLRVQLPGTTHNNNSPLSLPYYNCPLGVFNIANTPVLQKSAPYQQFIESGYEDSYDSWGNRTGRQNYTANVTLSTFQVGNDLHAIYNTSAGLIPISMQGAIVFKCANTPSDSRNGDYGNARTDILADPYVGPYSVYALQEVTALQSANPLLAQFEAGNLIVNNMTATSIEFQTPFTNMSCLQSVTAIAPANATAFVRVRGIFQRADAPEQPPIALVFDYNTTIAPNASVSHNYGVDGQADDSWYPGYGGPLVQGSGYRNLTIAGPTNRPIVFGPAANSEGDNMVIRAGQSIAVTGNVQFPAGTTVGLTTEFLPISCSGTSPLALNIGSCDAYAQTWWRSALATAPDTPTAALEVFPNPTKGTFTLNPPLVFGEHFNLTVYDFVGRIVHAEKLIYQGKPLPITLAQLKTGVYALKVTATKSGQYTTKLAVE